MTDEYYEARTRYYMPKKKKDENLLTKFTKIPMKMVGLGGDKHKSDKEKRLTA